MSIVSDNLKTIDDARQLIVDAGLRTTRVYLRLNAWSGGEVRLGSLTTTDTEIVPRPKVEQRNGGHVLISGITPSYGTGGWLPSDLNPADLVGEEHIFILVGPSGALNPYRAVAFDGRKPFNLKFEAEQLDRRRPNEGW